METKTLNKKQQRSTLAAKKTKVKETIKNVVATPYNNSYWPQISREDHHTLEQVLEKSLPKIKNETINIPWRELKNIPKAERKEFRKNYAKNDRVEIDENARYTGHTCTELGKRKTLSAVCACRRMMKRQSILLPNKVIRLC